MGRHSRKDHRPNGPKHKREAYQPVIQEVETPQGPHKFAMLPSFGLYWVTPEGPWRKVSEDASK